MLEGPLRKSRFAQPGQRVVHGQRLMQAAERHLPGLDRGGRGPVLLLAPAAGHEGLGAWSSRCRRRPEFYARLCGWTLARAHARSGDPIAIAAYLGDDDTFDLAITDFSQRYADQNERDYDAFVDAVRTSRIEAVEGV